MPGYVILMTDRLAEPGMASVLVFGANGRRGNVAPCPVRTLDRARVFPTAQDASGEILRWRSKGLYRTWLPTIAPFDGPGIPPLPGALEPDYE